MRATVSSKINSVSKMVNNVNQKAERVSMMDNVGGTTEGKFTHTPEVYTRYFYNSISTRESQICWP